MIKNNLNFYITGVFSTIVYFPTVSNMFLKDNFRYYSNNIIENAHGSVMKYTFSTGLYDLLLNKEADEEYEKEREREEK